MRTYEQKAYRMARLISRGLGDPSVEYLNNIELSSYFVKKKQLVSYLQRSRGKSIERFIQTYDKYIYNTMYLSENNALIFAHSQGIREIYHDLLALRRDFCSVKLSIKKTEEYYHENHCYRICEISVTTDSIVLQNIDFGQFIITVQYYIAKDQSIFDFAPSHGFVTCDPITPYYASGSSLYAHPHVEDGELCIGYNGILLRRLYQFGYIEQYIHTISSILHTYNASSPYVRLELWDGPMCSECDVRMDDVYYCTDCDEMLCEECACACSSCGDSYCSSHIKVCSKCENTFCSRCLDGGMCLACREEQENRSGYFLMQKLLKLWFQRKIVEPF